MDIPCGLSARQESGGRRAVVGFEAGQGVEVVSEA